MMVNMDKPDAKPWWRHLRVVNVIRVSMVRPEVSPFGPAAICDSFDLSCCCVALQVQSDMTSKLWFYHGSEDDLDKGTMCLLPSSFWSWYDTGVGVQMLRVLKYANRGFKLVDDVRSNA